MNIITSTSPSDTHTLSPLPCNQVALVHARTLVPCDTAKQEAQHEEHGTEQNEVGVLGFHEPKVFHFTAFSGLKLTSCHRLFVNCAHGAESLASQVVERQKDQQILGVHRVGVVEVVGTCPRLAVRRQEQHNVRRTDRAVAVEVACAISVRKKPVPPNSSAHCGNTMVSA